MQARGFTYLGQIPRTQLLRVVADGLQLLAENTASLMDDAQACHQAGRPRGAAVLASYATEEAAKAMMLLDLARDGWQDLSLLRSMGQHLARLIYVWTYEGNPASLTEVHQHVDELRRSRVFLEDLPVVSRNPMLQEREELLYVDYVLTYEEERALKDASNGAGPPVTAVLGRWVSPESVWLPGARRAELLVPPIVDLLPMLERAGCLTPEGLTVIADTWRSDSGTFKEEPHYRNLEKLNHTVLLALEREGTLRDDFAGDDDVRGIAQGWSFPLTGITLRPKEVSDEEINQVFHRWAVAEGLIEPDDV